MKDPLVGCVSFGDEILSQVYMEIISQKKQYINDPHILKKPMHPLYRMYIGVYTTQLYKDNNKIIIRIRISQSEFNGKSAKLFEAHVMMFLGFGDVFLKAYVPSKTQ